MYLLRNSGTKAWLSLSVETSSPSWQFTGLTTRLREPRFAATRVPSRLCIIHFVLFRGRKSSALNFKRNVSIGFLPWLSFLHRLPTSARGNRLVKLELASSVGADATILEK